MEKTIKKEKEEFDTLAHAYQECYQPANNEDWGKGFWQCMEYSKSFIKHHTINILKAQNKELEEKIKVVNSLLYNLSDEMRGEIRGYEKLIKENNKIINNL